MPESELIKVVKGGYEVESSGEFIPANELISFGLFNDLPDTFLKHEEESEIEKLSLLFEKINLAVGNFADSMRAPYYMLGLNKVGTSLEIEARIQLYVLNK